MTNSVKASCNSAGALWSAESTSATKSSSSKHMRSCSGGAARRLVQGDPPACHPDTRRQLSSSDSGNTKGRLMNSCTLIGSRSRPMDRPLR
jgi:hypothetical protein